jgi:hypothetical protein
MRPPKAFAPADSDDRMPNDERRAVVRYRAALAVPFQAVGKPPLKEARVRDLSIFGIGLRTDESVELSALLEIELRSPRQSTVRTVFARVVHVEPITAGGWLVGCAFVEELSENDMRLFQAERQFAHEQDSRRWVRFPCNLETVCYTSETAPGERRAARIINVSPGGVGVLLRCEFYVGTLLYLELPHEMGHREDKLLVRVVRLIEHSPGTWFLGCEFAHQLQLEEIKALVAKPARNGSR